MELASKFVKLEKAKLWVVFVLEVPRALPLDATIPEEVERGDKILDRAAEIAENMGLDVETHQLQAREAGPAIVDEAKDLGIDLIVVGMSSKGRLGELFGGGSSTVNYILKRSPCQVWIVAKGQEGTTAPMKKK